MVVNFTIYGLHLIWFSGANVFTLAPEFSGANVNTLNPRNSGFNVFTLAPDEK
jgi:hypothetical protein